MNTLLCQSKGEFLEPTHTVITNKREQAKGILTPHTLKPNVIIYFYITTLSLHTEFIQILLLFPFCHLTVCFSNFKKLWKQSSSGVTNGEMHYYKFPNSIPFETNPHHFNWKWYCHVKIQTFFIVTLIISFVNHMWLHNGQWVLFLSFKMCYVLFSWVKLNHFTIPNFVATFKCHLYMLYTLTLAFKTS